MTRQSQHELFAQRPVRSDFARGRGGGGGGLNLRKLILVCVALVIAIAIGYLVSGLGSDQETTGETPIVQAELPIKQRPEEPGGIDIPHQDVTVFQKLDNSGEQTSKKTGVEHLLPEPATPKDVSDTKTGGEPLPASATESVAPSPDAQPVAKVEEQLPPAITEAEPPKPEPVKVEAPTPAPVAVVKKEAAKVEKKLTEKEKTAEEKAAAAIAAAKKLTPSTASKPSSAVETATTETAVARLPKELFTGDTPPAVKAEPAAPEAKATTSETTSTNGKKPQVQLASYPNQAEAEREVKKFQNKYAGILGSTTLTVVRAEIPGKGTYYRIMGAAGTESKAKAICADIVKQKGNCLVIK